MREQHQQRYNLLQHTLLQLTMQQSAACEPCRRQCEPKDYCRQLEQVCRQQCEQCGVSGWGQ